MTSDSNSKKVSAKYMFNNFGKKYGSLLILVLLCIILLFTSPTFKTPQNLINILRQVSMNGIIALGTTFVIIGGGIDLSVGSIVAMTSVICGAYLSGQPVGWGIVLVAALVAILASAGVGVFNGFFISKFGMFPFVVTLSTQMIVRGVAYLISDAKSFVINSQEFKVIGKGSLLGIPVPIVIFFVCAVIAYILLHHTKFGRYVYAVGGNPKAAIASGINLMAVRIGMFVICAVFTCVSGIITSSRVNAGQPSIGVAYETDAIAAAVIGGTSFNGGIGTIPGTIIGTLVIGVINNGMNLLKVSSFWQQIVKGFIIIGAVLLDLTISKKRQMS